MSEFWTHHEMATVWLCLGTETVWFSDSIPKFA